MADGRSNSRSSSRRDEIEKYAEARERIIRRSGNIEFSSSSNSSESDIEAAKKEKNQRREEAEEDEEETRCKRSRTRRRRKSFKDRTSCSYCCYYYYYYCLYRRTYNKNNEKESNQIKITAKAEKQQQPASAPPPLLLHEPTKRIRSSSSTSFRGKKVGRRSKRLRKGRRRESRRRQSFEERIGAKLDEQQQQQQVSSSSESSDVEEEDEDEDEDEDESTHASECVDGACSSSSSSSENSECERERTRRRKIVEFRESGCRCCCSECRARCDFFSSFARLRTSSDAAEAALQAQAHDCCWCGCSSSSSSRLSCDAESSSSGGRRCNQHQSRQQDEAHDQRQPLTVVVVVRRRGIRKRSRRRIRGRRSRRRRSPTDAGGVTIDAASFSRPDGATRVCRRQPKRLGRRLSLAGRLLLLLLFSPLCLLLLLSLCSSCHSNGMITSRPDSGKSFVHVDSTATSMQNKHHEQLVSRFTETAAVLATLANNNNNNKKLTLPQIESAPSNHQQQHQSSYLNQAAKRQQHDVTQKVNQKGTNTRTAATRNSRNDFGEKYAPQQEKQNHHHPIQPAYLHLFPSNGETNKQQQQTRQQQQQQQRQKRTKRSHRSLDDGSLALELESLQKSGSASSRGSTLEAGRGDGQQQQKQQHLAKAQLYSKCLKAITCDDEKSSTTAPAFSPPPPSLSSSSLSSGAQLKDGSLVASATAAADVIQQQQQQQQQSAAELQQLSQSGSSRVRSRRRLKQKPGASNSESDNTGSWWSPAASKQLTNDNNNNNNNISGPSTSTSSTSTFTSTATTSAASSSSSSSTIGTSGNNSEAASAAALSSELERAREAEEARELSSLVLLKQRQQSIAATVAQEHAPTHLGQAELRRFRAEALNQLQLRNSLEQAPAAAQTPTTLVTGPRDLDSLEATPTTRQPQLHNSRTIAASQSGDSAGRQKLKSAGSRRKTIHLTTTSTATTTTSQANNVDDVGVGGDDVDADERGDTTDNEEEEQDVDADDEKILAAAAAAALRPPNGIMVGGNMSKRVQQLESLSPLPPPLLTRDLLVAQDTQQQPQYRWPFIGLVGFMFLGATGNILVCMAISRERRLQTATNYFLLSLALADLLVCTLVMPFGIIYEFYGLWPFDWRICNVWVTCDVLTCSSSILHMCFISVGRYLGIRNPLHARQANLFVSRRAVLWRIGIAWISAALIASPITMMSLYDHKNIVPSPNECAISNKYFLMFGSMLAFFIPMFAMVPSYIMTVRLLSRRAKFVRNNSLQLAAKTQQQQAAAARSFSQQHRSSGGGGAGKSGGGQLAPAAEVVLEQQLAGQQAPEQRRLAEAATTAQQHTTTTTMNADALADEDHAQREPLLQHQQQQQEEQEERELSATAKANVQRSSYNEQQQQSANNDNEQQQLGEEEGQRLTERRWLEEEKKQSPVWLQLISSSNMHKQTHANDTLLAAASTDTAQIPSPPCGLLTNNNANNNNNNSNNAAAAAVGTTTTSSCLANVVLQCNENDDEQLEQQEPATEAAAKGGLEMRRRRRFDDDSSNHNININDRPTTTTTTNKQSCGSAGVVSGCANQKHDDDDENYELELEEEAQLAGASVELGQTTTSTATATAAESAGCSSEFAENRRLDLTAGIHSVALVSQQQQHLNQCCCCCCCRRRRLRNGQQSSGYKLEKRKRLLPLEAERHRCSSRHQRGCGKHGTWNDKEKEEVGLEQQRRRQKLDCLTAASREELGCIMQRPQRPPEALAAASVACSSKKPQQQFNGSSAHDHDELLLLAMHSRPPVKVCKRQARRLQKQNQQQKNNSGSNFSNSNDATGALVPVPVPQIEGQFSAPPAAANIITSSGLNKTEAEQEQLAALESLSSSKVAAAQEQRKASGRNQCRKCHCCCRCLKCELRRSQRHPQRNQLDAQENNNNDHLPPPKMHLNNNNNNNNKAERAKVEQQPQQQQLHSGAMQSFATTAAALNTVQQQPQRTNERQPLASNSNDSKFVKSDNNNYTSEKPKKPLRQDHDDDDDDDDDRDKRQAEEEENNHCEEHDSLAAAANSVVNHLAGHQRDAKRPTTATAAAAACAQVARRPASQQCQPLDATAATAAASACGDDELDVDVVVVDGDEQKSVKISGSSTSTTASWRPLEFVAGADTGTAAAASAAPLMCSRATDAAQSFRLNGPSQHEWRQQRPQVVVNCVPLMHSISLSSRQQTTLKTPDAYAAAQSASPSEAISARALINLLDAHQILKDAAASSSNSTSFIDEDDDEDGEAGEAAAYEDDTELRLFPAKVANCATSSEQTIKASLAPTAPAGSTSAANYIINDDADDEPQPPETNFSFKQRRQTSDWSEDRKSVVVVDAASSVKVEADKRQQQLKVDDHGKKEFSRVSRLKSSSSENEYEWKKEQVEEEDQRRRKQDFEKKEAKFPSGGDSSERIRTQAAKLAALAGNSADFSRRHTFGDSDTTDPHDTCSSPSGRLLTTTLLGPPAEDEALLQRQQSGERRKEQGFLRMATNISPSVAESRRRFLSDSSSVTCYSLDGEAPAAAFEVDDATTNKQMIRVPVVVVGGRRQRQQQQREVAAAASKQEEEKKMSGHECSSSSFAGEAGQQQQQQLVELLVSSSGLPTNKQQRQQLNLRDSNDNKSSLSFSRNKTRRDNDVSIGLRQQQQQTTMNDLMTNVAAVANQESSAAAPHTALVVDTELASVEQMKQRGLSSVSLAGFQLNPAAAALVRLAARRHCGCTCGGCCCCRRWLRRLQRLQYKQQHQKQQKGQENDQLSAATTTIAEPTKPLAPTSQGGGGGGHHLSAEQKVARVGDNYDEHQLHHHHQPNTTTNFQDTSSNKNNNNKNNNENKTPLTSCSARIHDNHHDHDDQFYYSSQLQLLLPQLATTTATNTLAAATAAHHSTSMIKRSKSEMRPDDRWYRRHRVCHRHCRCCYADEDEENYACSSSPSLVNAHPHNRSRPLLPTNTTSIHNKPHHHDSHHHHHHQSHYHCDHHQHHHHHGHHHHHHGHCHQQKGGAANKENKKKSDMKKQVINGGDGRCSSLIYRSSKASADGKRVGQSGSQASSGRDAKEKKCHLCGLPVRASGISAEAGITTTPAANDHNNHNKQQQVVANTYTSANLVDPIVPTLTYSCPDNDDDIYRESSANSEKIDVDNRNKSDHESETSSVQSQASTILELKSIQLQRRNSLLKQNANSGGLVDDTNDDELSHSGVLVGSQHKSTTCMANNLQPEHQQQSKHQQKRKTSFCCSSSEVLKPDHTPPRGSGFPSATPSSLTTISRLSFRSFVKRSQQQAQQHYDVAANNNSTALGQQQLNQLEHQPLGGGTTVNNNNHNNNNVNEPPQMIRYLGSSMQVRSEQKATKVLGVVFFTFVICWTPFFVINFTQAFVERQELSKWISNEMMTTFLWLGYISSTINPVIYTVFNRNFRRAFREIILCRPPTHRRYRLKGARHHQFNPAGGAGGGGTMLAANEQSGKSFRLSQYGRHLNAPTNPIASTMLALTAPASSGLMGVVTGSGGESGGAALHTGQLSSDQLPADAGTSMGGCGGAQLTATTTTTGSSGGCSAHSRDVVPPAGITSTMTASTMPSAAPAASNGDCHVASVTRQSTVANASAATCYMDRQQSQDSSSRQGTGASDLLALDELVSLNNEAGVSTSNFNNLPLAKQTLEENVENKYSASDFGTVAAVEGGRNKQHSRRLDLNKRLSYNGGGMPTATASSTLPPPSTNTATTSTTNEVKSTTPSSVSLLQSALRQSSSLITSLALPGGSGIGRSPKQRRNSSVFKDTDVLTRREAHSASEVDQRLRQFQSDEDMEAGLPLVTTTGQALDGGGCHHQGGWRGLQRFRRFNSAIASSGTSGATLTSQSPAGYAIQQPPPSNSGHLSPPINFHQQGGGQRRRSSSMKVRLSFVDLVGVFEDEDNDVHK